MGVRIRKWKSLSVDNYYWLRIDIIWELVLTENLYQLRINLKWELLSSCNESNIRKFRIVLIVLNLHTISTHWSWLLIIRIFWICNHRICTQLAILAFYLKSVDHCINCPMYKTLTQHVFLHKYTKKRLFCA